MQNKNVDFIRARLAFSAEEVLGLLFSSLVINRPRSLELDGSSGVKADLRLHNRKDPVAPPATVESDRIT